MMRTLLLGLLAITGGLLSGACTAAADGPVGELVITVTQARIVIDKDCSPSEQFAAKELQDHIEQMTGTEIPIVNTAPQPGHPMTFILVGNKTVKAAHPEVKLDDLGTDGFVVKAVSSLPKTELLIAGGEQRGTLYGVYTYLESLGVRWWTPSETHIPKLSSLPLPKEEIRQKPKLEYRDMMYQFVFSDAGKLWYARNKLNGMAWDDAPAKLGGRYTFVGNLVHGSSQTVARGKTKVTEGMKALVKGKRTAAQFCLSSDETLKAMVKGVLASYEKTPDARFVVIGQQDNRSYCQCDKCAAIDKAEDSNCGHNLAFANRVAEEVEKQRPGSAVCTAAYEWSRKPPKNITPRFNVFITLCSIECDFAHPLATAENEVNKTFREDFAAWGKVCPRLYIWDYVTNFRHHLMPFPNLDAIVPNIKFFADNGALGVFEQGAHKSAGSEFVGLRSWVMAKALWNPDADGRKLVEEFANGYYGPAAPHVLKYIDIIHEPARKQDFVMRIYRLLDGPYIAPEVMAQAEVALRQAEVAAKGDADIERRVRHAHMPVWYVLAKRGPGSPTWKAVNAALAPTGKLDMNHIATQFAQVVKDYHINAVADGEVVGPWLSWQKDYGEQCSGDTFPVPPELKGKDLSKIRLIQGCQFDGRGRWYTKAEGASDGWGVRQPTVGWTVTCGFDDPDHFQTGKTYRLKVRAKADVKPEAKGRAWNGGVWRSSVRKTPARVNVTAEQARDRQWHVYDLGTFKPLEGDIFYFATDPKLCNEVVIDCMWLEEIEPEE